MNYKDANCWLVVTETVSVNCAVRILFIEIYKLPIVSLIANSN